MVIISKEHCKPSSKIIHTLPGLATVYKNFACNFTMHKCKAEIYFNKDFLQYSITSSSCHPHGVLLTLK